jgi:hypothetical protein
MTSIYTGGGSLIPPGPNNPGSQPYGNGIAGLPTSSPNPFAQNPYSPVGTAFQGFGNDTPSGGGGGFLTPLAQQPTGNPMGPRNPAYNPVRDGGLPNPYAPRPMTGGGDARPMYPHNTYPGMETPRPMNPEGIPFYGFGDDVPMVRADDNVPQGGGGFLTPYASPNPMRADDNAPQGGGGFLSPYASPNPMRADDNVPPGSVGGTLTPMQPGYSGQLMPTQTLAPERHDIMYGASPMGGFNPFMGNQMTQGQAAAQANTTTTSTTAPTPTYGFTGTNPFVQRGLTEAEFKAQSIGMASGGLAGLTGNAIYPQSRTDATQYAINTQLPTSSEVVGADYDAKTNAYTGMPYRFARGGIASIPRFDGETGSQVEAPPEWNPESGQVKLQTPDPEDPYGGMKTIDYTIPQDQIKNYAPTLDLETGKPTGGGAYVLNDGSTMHIGRDGIVQATTPGRNDYKLNEQGYYQPVGENLTWNGGANMLTKKIGGVDVVVDPMFTKGGYQDAKGNLRVDENGVPIPLAPNYLDSGVGKSGLSDAAPYIAAAAMMAATGMPTGFEGMVPASETLLGSMGYLGAGSTAGISSADLGTTSYIAPQSSVFPGVSTADLGTTPYLAPSSSASIAPQMGPTYAELGYQGAGAKSTADAIAAADAASKAAAAKTASMTPMQKYVAATMAAKALSSGSGGGGGGPSSTTTTTQNPPAQNVASNQFNPNMVMPNMFAMNQAAPGMYYQPQTYRYYAQGGVADLGGYAAGGKLLKGPGDGMSDSIVANIAGKQPARLADGEFVVPADVVSHLGNGSTDAGAKHLYKMMDRIRQARTGNSKQGKRINPNKFLPKG